VTYAVIPAGHPQQRLAQIQEQAIAWIQQQVLQQVPGKIVVYANTRTMPEDIAVQLCCPAYHNRPADKGDTLASFREREREYIVAMSALGMGIDIPDIRVVVHVGRMR